MLCFMATNTASPKSRVLGNALRQAREEKGLGLRQLATELDLDYSALSKWERGLMVPKDVVVARILTHLGINGERYDEILKMPVNADASQWLAVTLPEQRQHLSAILDFENSAATITTVSPLLIPGLLQTSGYIRAIMSAGTVPEGEIATRVAVRIGRRDALTGRNAANLVALIGEAALRQVVGSADVMVDQLDHLLEVGKAPNVTVRVLPYASGWHPGLEGPFNLIDPRADSDMATMSVVHLENRRSGLFLHEEEDVAMYRHAVDTLLRAAMSPSQSAELIAAVIKEMRT